MRFAPYILTGYENLAFTSATYFSRKWPERKKIIIKHSCGSEVNEGSDYDNYGVVNNFSQNNINIERTNAWLF
jgi:hypothetical protein